MLKLPFRDTELLYITEVFILQIFHTPSPKSKPSRYCVNCLHLNRYICLRAQIKAEVRQERKSRSRIVLFREKAMTPFLENQSNQESSVARGFQSWATRARGIFSCCFISLFCDSRGWVLGLQPYPPQSYIPSSPCYIRFNFFVCLFACFLRQGLK